MTTNNPYADALEAFNRLYNNDLKDRLVRSAFPNISSQIDSDVQKVKSVLSQLHEQAEMVKRGELLPCPFCGGEPLVDEKYMSPTMNGNKNLISVTIRHHCPKVDGQPSTMNVSKIGRDRQSAITAWNTRAVLKDLEV